MALFKDRLKQLRLENNLTLKELGQKLGYSESTMSMYESGKREPKKSEDYVKISDFFDVSLDYLLGKAENRQGLIVKDKVDNDDVELEVDKDIYPDGLTHDEVIKILEGLKAAGVNLKPDNENK